MPEILNIQTNSKQQKTIKVTMQMNRFIKVENEICQVYNILIQHNIIIKRSIIKIKQRSQMQGQLCDDNGWCTFQSVDHQSMIVQVVFIGILFFMALFIFKYFCMLLHYRKNQDYQHLFGAAFLRVYQLVLVWLFCSLIKMSINIVTYYLYISQDYNTFPTPRWYSPIVILSSIFNLFDELTTFFVIWLIILIPYQWFKFLMQHINDINNLISLESRRLYSWSFKLLKIVKIYMIIRLVQLLFYAAQAVLLVITNIGCSFPSYSTAVFIGQSIFLLFFYLFIFYVAQHTYSKRFVIMKTQDYYRIRIEYSLLIIALLARILLNSFFSRFATYIIDYQPEVNCFDKNAQNNLKRSMFLIFGFTIMQFLPISLVLYIYRPHIHQKYKDQSILKLSDVLVDGKQDNIFFTDTNSSRQSDNKQHRRSSGKKGGNKNKDINEKDQRKSTTANSKKKKDYNFNMSTSQLTLGSIYNDNENHYNRIQD